MKPVKLEEIDISSLIKICEDHIDEIAENDEDENTKHYIYETAMETVFGKDVWNWINHVAS